MKTRVRMGIKPTAKGICNVDVTVDCDLENEETTQDVAVVLKEAVGNYRTAVQDLGYTNIEIESK
jgi:hypothetical protein